MEELTATQKEYVDLMKDTVQSNLALIGDLLDVNMLQEQNEVNHTSTFSISNLLHERVVSFQHACTSKKIDLKLIHSIDQNIIGHPNYTGRILDNLISNAIKFSQRESEVIVKASVDLSVLKLSVKDNGPGFTDTDQKMLYQKFKRLSAQPTAGESSNGLGLAIVKTLVERMHGEINLESQLGKGSEFTVRIPVKVVAKVTA
jgi:signal transduction histidine kinase